MPDAAILESAGGRPEKESKYTPIYTGQFIGGLATQRSPFISIDSRYSKRFLGNKTDTLLAGSNCEISNKLTLQRRPGNPAWSTASIPAPLDFYAWEQDTPPSLQLVVDTASAVYLYTPTSAGILMKKSAGSGLTNFATLNDTLYMYDGVDAMKFVGPNLLTYSDTFTNAIWVKSNVVFTVGQTDPSGTLTASQAAFSNTSGYFTQTQTPPYSPVASTTFTGSIYINAPSGTPTIHLTISDQSGVLQDKTVTLSAAWARYSVTASSGAGSTSLTFSVNTPSATGNYVVWDAQLEPGGTATNYQATTNLPQGLYPIGIVAPVTAPTLFFSAYGNAWQASHAYTLTNTITDSNGNLQTVTGVTGDDKSGATAPKWAVIQGTTTTDNHVTWTNGGPNGLNPLNGYTWYYAYRSSLTSNSSSASPISANSGVLVGQSATLTADYSPNPSVDLIDFYRNTDGGPYYYRLATVSNPPSGTASYVDVLQDTSLNTEIYAPIVQLNNPPPTGMKGIEFWAGRYWGFVGQDLYFSTGADNASLVNITFNGVSAECWSPSNVLPLPMPITRIVPQQNCLVVFMTGGCWAVTGTTLASFFPAPLFANLGLRNYKALDLDGSNMYLYTADRQFLVMAPSSGTFEIGFPVGDSFELNVDPTKAQVVRHVSGSQDNCILLGDGSTGWYRGNPNQVGANSSDGVATPVWSPFATIVGGCGAIASVETSYGVHQLLVGGTVTGPVLARSLTSFVDNVTSYTWSAQIGCLLLSSAGTLANVDSVSVQSYAAGGIPTVGVLLNEISGSFTTLTNYLNEPPQLAASTTLNSYRYEVAQGKAPLCSFMQILLSGAAANTKDEVLSFTIRGKVDNEEQ
jgi:hypothetical protein